jgi:hypothetical protein
VTDKVRRYEGGMDYPRTSDADLLAAHVRRRVWGRVDGLDVQAQDCGVVLKGRTRTYYEKILAQQAVLEKSLLPLLANKIEVF